MAQLVKRMLFKREDPSLNRQNVSEEPGLLVYVSKPSDGDVETGRSLELNWPARLLEAVGSRFSNRPWRMAPNNHPWPPHRYIHSSHMYAHLPHPHAVKEKGRKEASISLDRSDFWVYIFIYCIQNLSKIGGLILILAIRQQGCYWPESTELWNEGVCL